MVFYASSFPPICADLLNWNWFFRVLSRVLPEKHAQYFKTERNHDRDTCKYEPFYRKHIPNWKLILAPGWNWTGLQSSCFSCAKFDVENQRWSFCDIRSFSLSLTDLRACISVFIRSIIFIPDINCEFHSSITFDMLTTWSRTMRAFPTKLPLCLTDDTGLSCTVRTQYVASIKLQFDGKAESNEHLASIFQNITYDFGSLGWWEFSWASSSRHFSQIDRYNRVNVDQNTGIFRNTVRKPVKIQSTGKKMFKIENCADERRKKFDSV